MKYISFILSTAGLITLILASAIKTKSTGKILALVSAGNLLMALSYLFAVDGANGAVSSFLGAVQSIINFSFTSKNKPIPLSLIWLYAVSFIALNLLFISSYTGIFAILACLCFVGSISSKKASGYRLWVTANCTFWIIYDAVSMSYAPLVTHIILGAFTIIGMFINRENSNVTEK